MIVDITTLISISKTKLSTMSSLPLCRYRNLFAFRCSKVNTRLNNFIFIFFFILFLFFCQVLQGEHAPKRCKSKQKRRQLINFKSYCQINQLINHQSLHLRAYEISSLWKVIQPSLAAFAKGEVAMSGQLNQMKEDPTLGRNQSLLNY